MLYNPMKKSQKISVFLITLVVGLSFLSPVAMSQTTIGNSTIPVEVDDVITWKCTYLHVTLYPIYYGAGSILEYTIEEISRGSHGPLSYALIANITEKFDYTNIVNYTKIVNTPTYLVYNKSLNYIEYNKTESFDFKAFIVPIPLNLTLVADYFETLGYTCEVDGNKLRFIDGDSIKENTYNSNGLLTKYEWRNTAGDLAMRYKLVVPDKDVIPLGLSFLLFTALTVLSLVAILKKRVFSKQH
jgi:hypothetical protein